MTTDTITVPRGEIEALLCRMRMYDYDADEFNGRYVTKAWANDLEPIISRATPRHDGCAAYYLDCECDACKARDASKETTPRQVSDEDAAYKAWFNGEQGKTYDGMWHFAKAAWMARAALASLPHHAAKVLDALTKEQLEDCIEAIKNGINPASRIFIPRGWNVLLERLEALLAAAPECKERAK